MTTLAADSPITTKAEDRLQYRAFAEALARSIVYRAPSDGFVIGVQAQWGMGKSSAINLTLEAIRELQGDAPERGRIQVRPFNPWLFSGLETLAAAYLSELGRVVENTLDQGTPERTRRFVKDLIRGGAEMIGGLTAVGTVLATGGTAAPAAAAVKSAVTGGLNYGAHRIDNRSLDDMIDDLRGHLAGIGTKILVVVDDLDRLQPDEVRQVLTLVKTFGNLPNVIHLLIYDRAIVDRAVGGTASPSDKDRRLPTYLEKIVQVALDLPPPDLAGLRSMTFERLTAIVGPAPPMNEEDWSTVAHIAFEHYLRSPRDVARLCNALSVTWPAVVGEVYLPDLVAIEMLRHFDERTCDAIRSNKGFLVGQGGPLGEDERKTLARSIVESALPSRRDDVVDLVCMMFPAIHGQLKPNGFTGHEQSETLTGRRIGAPDGFDAYFRFSSPTDEIPLSDLRALKERLGSPGYVRAAIQAVAGRYRSDGISFAGPLLDEIRKMLKGGAACEPGLLETLLDLADPLLIAKDEVADFSFITTNGKRLRRLFTAIVERLPPEGRGDAIAVAINRSSAGLHACALIVALLGEDHGIVRKPEKRRSSPLLPLADVERIGSLVAGRIGEAARTENLATQPCIDLVISVWSAFSGPEGPKAWVLDKLAAPRAAVDLAFGEMSLNYSSAPPYRFRRMSQLPDAAVFDSAALADALEEHLAHGRVDAADRPGAEYFVKRARLLLGGPTEGGNLDDLAEDDS
ncbi:KAP family P-loop NTPase fold protein [Methylobacterium radiodurans]|nr:P-loop NTPase fold protein [Methylobacterium radiodurans]